MKKPSRGKAFHRHFFSLNRTGLDRFWFGSVGIGYLFDDVKMQPFLKTICSDKNKHDVAKILLVFSDRC
jgi:hypothetical protein